MNGIIENSMAIQRFILDTNVIIDVLNGKLDLLAFLTSFSDYELYINPVIKIEVLARPDMSAVEEAEARVLLDAFSLKEIDNLICEIAIQICRDKELRLPDALIAASAIALNATVLSNDSHFLDYRRTGYIASAVKH
jgi:predicted nucleic acid-binding protein